MPVVTSNIIYNLGHRVANALLKPLCRPEVFHRERVPTDGRVIVASNHTSYLDPLLLGAAFDREFHYMAKDTLFWPPFGWLLRQVNAFPVKRGTADLSALRHALKVLQNEWGLLIFPEGTRGTGEEFLAARKGVGFLVRRTRAPVVPVYIEGAEQVLGRGHTWPHRHQIRLYVGEMLTFPSDAEAEAIAETVLASIRQLRDHRQEIQHSPPTP